MSHQGGKARQGPAGTRQCRATGGAPKVADDEAPCEPTQCRRRKRMSRRWGKPTRRPQATASMQPTTGNPAEAGYLGKYLDSMGSPVSKCTKPGPTQRAGESRRKKAIGTT